MTDNRDGPMGCDRDIDYWREANGGFRGSHLLRAGAALLALGALLALAAAAAGAAGPPALVEAGWLAYLLGLGATGLGFAWSGVAAILPRIALAAAALHVAQSAYLLFLLYGRSEPPVAPVALTVGRLASLVVFSILASGSLGRPASRALGGVAAAALAKTLLRVLAPGIDGGPALDAVFLVAMAAAIALTARRLRALEDAWGREHDRGRRSDFSEFNNPEHEWNKGRREP